LNEQILRNHCEFGVYSVAPSCTSNTIPYAEAMQFVSDSDDYA
jgi:hypothetical protein